MIKKLYKKYEEVILYVVFGGLTTLVNFVSFWVFTLPATTAWAATTLISA